MIKAKAFAAPTTADRCSEAVTERVNWTLPGGLECNTTVYATVSQCTSTLEVIVLLLEVINLEKNRLVNLGYLAAPCNRNLGRRGSGNSNFYWMGLAQRREEQWKPDRPLLAGVAQHSGAHCHFC